MKPTQINLTKEQRIFLKSIAAKTKVSMAEHIRRAINKYIVEIPQPPKR